MCGICGCVNLRQGGSVAPELLHRMCDSLFHRGPDDVGTYLHGPVGLGVRRLSIIDRAGGHQPLANENADVWVVLNGEIYNYLDLRRELEGRGHRFRTRSDTEVLAHLYEDHGVDCLRHLRGMFAFAVWDVRRQRLFLARDRLGKKPLVYARTGEALLFASEIKALLCDPAVSRTLDLEALDDYLSLQYVPHPRTIFAGIAKLPPAHYLLCERGTISVERYWTLDFMRKATLTEEEAVEGVRQHLREATRLRLVGEVPLGALLSGGIDSSAVVATMSALSDRPVKTFAIGFEGDRADELPYARMVAKAFATDHQELIVKPDLREIIPDFVRTYDEPFADPSAIPSLYVCRLARTQVTIALNGDGGDEAFGGYEQYRLPGWGRWLAGRPWIAEAEGSLIGTHFRTQPATAWGRKLRKRLRGFVAPAAARFLNADAFDGGMKHGLYLPEVLLALTGRVPREMVDRFLAERREGVDVLDRMLAFDTSWYLPDDLLYKMDIASMAYSLEARSPFLDHRVMEFAASLPASLKVRGREQKYVLKRALRGLLPAEILSRRKRGFTPPLRAWLREELYPLAEEVLTDPACITRRLFHREAIAQLLREHREGRRNHARRLWSLVVLGMWHRQFGQGVALP